MCSQSRLNSDRYIQSIESYQNGICLERVSDCRRYAFASSLLSGSASRIRPSKFKAITRLKLTELVDGSLSSLSSTYR